jgi:hypothetical protein
MKWKRRKCPGGSAGEMAAVGAQGRPECAGPNALARKFQLIPRSKILRSPQTVIVQTPLIHTDQRA